MDHESLVLESVGKSFYIVQQRFVKGSKDAARSTDKLHPIHGAINLSLREGLDSAYYVISFGASYEEKLGKINLNGAELGFPGHYEDKRVDVSIATRSSEIKHTPTGRVAKNEPYIYIPLGGIFSKIVFANWKQNMSTYFGGFRSETSNLRKLGYKIGQLMIINHKPIFRLNDGNIKHVEQANKDDLARYLKLFSEDPLEDYERPDAMCVMVVDIDNNGKVSKTKPEDLGFDPLTDKEVTVQYLEMSDFNKFIINFREKCQIK